MKKLILSIILGGGILVSQSFALPLQDVAKVVSAGGKAATNVIDAAKGQKALNIQNTVVTEKTNIKAGRNVNLGVKARLRGVRSANINNTTVMKKTNIKAGRDVNAGVDVDMR